MENNGMEDILKDSQFTEMDPESPEFVEGIFNEMVELHNDLVGLLQDLSAGHPDKHDLMKVRIISPAFILVRYTALFMIKPECIYFKHKYEEVKAVAWDLSNYGEAFEKGDRDVAKLADIITGFREYLTDMYAILTAEGWKVNAPFAG